MSTVLEVVHITFTHAMDQLLVTSIDPYSRFWMTLSSKFIYIKVSMGYTASNRLTIIKLVRKT